MDFTASVFAVLTPSGKPVGTGFLAAPTLAVTCAHVIQQTGAVPGETVQIQFHGHEEIIPAHISSEHWSDVGQSDVAILELPQALQGIYPLRLAAASATRPGSTFRSFGYAIAANVQGIHANGTIDGYLPAHQLLQLQSTQASKGISGAPVLAQSGVVLGMITKGHQQLGRNENTTFATPSEVIWQVCPQLKPIVSPLPRRNPIVEGIHLLPYDYDVRIQNFLTEYLGTDTHPVPFGGRDDALKMLDTWLAETTPYLLLAAPAGRGKSALLVRWLDGLKDREDLALTFVPVSIRFGTNMERVFYAALAARLAFLHGVSDELPIRSETRTDEYKGLVSKLLSKPLANGRTLLVVLDGLDEAADWQTGADFMPDELPNGMRVVVSARFLAGDADSTPWLRRLNWERNELASAPSLAPLDQEGVRDVLFKMNAPLDELSRNVDIVTELYRLSEGDPLLVGLYVDDLWAKGEEVTRLQSEDLANIEPGYKGYFDRWWDDQKKLWGKDKPWLEKHVRTVRNLLAGSLGPLFRDDFQALEPELESDYITDALDTLQRFIIGDNQNQGYTLSHPKLGQYFWEALTLTEQAQMEKCFLAWCEQIFQEFIEGKRDPKKKAEVPVYVVRNYGAHLARANQPIEKWLPLIHHQGWAQAWFTVEGAYGGYSQDVQCVWEKCRLLDSQTIEKTGKAPYISQQIRCGLIEASLSSLVVNIPSDLIPILVQFDIWKPQQALSMLQQIPEQAKKAEAICELLHLLGDEQLSDILIIGRTFQDEKLRAIILGTLIHRLPEVTDEALTTICTIKSKEDRAFLLGKIIQTLSKDDLEQVLKVLKTIRNDISNDRVFRHVKRQLLAGTLEKTQETVSLIEYEVPDAIRIFQLSRHVPDMIKAIPIVRKLVRLVQDFDYADDLAILLDQMEQELPTIARNQLAMAQLIQDELERVALLSMLAQYLPEAVGEAIVAARASRQSLGLAFRYLVQNLPERELGRVLTELQALQPIQPTGEYFDSSEDEYDNSTLEYVLSDLAQRMPQDELILVLSTTQDIDRETSKCAEVLGVLAQRVREGDLSQVLSAARTIQNKQGRAHVLRMVAQRWPNIVDEALDETLNIQNVNDRAFALLQLMHIQPSIVGETTSAILEVQNKQSRILLLGRLAQYLPGLAEQAMLEVQSIPDELSRTIMLRELISCLPKDAMEKVLAAAQEIEDKRHRATVLTELVPHLPNVYVEALTLIQFFGEEELIKMLHNAPQTVNEVLVAARSDKMGHARVLSQVAHYLPEITEEALVTACSIDGAYRQEILSTLVRPLFTASKNKAYLLLEMTLDKLSLSKRMYLFSDLAALMPVIVHIGTPDTPREIYSAIRDVTTWWP